MYINIQTMQRVTESEIRAAFPNTSFAQPFSPPEGYAVVFQSPAPTHDPMSQSYREVTPVQIDGKWYQAFEVFDLPQEQVAANLEAHAKALQASIVQATQARLDDFARQRNYDGILSAATYATSTNPQFQKEGQFCVEARDNTWQALYSILAEVQAGTRPVPTGYADVESALPVLDWANCV